MLGDLITETMNMVTGAARTARSRFVLAVFLVPLLGGCTILASRPVQLMSETGAAIRAAKEVQADTLAPELYRQANEWYFKAKHEYKFKNFHLAKEYATKARNFAELAEFQSIRNGGKVSEPPPPEATPAAAPYPYPTPTGVPADELERRQQQQKSGQPPGP